MCLIAPSSRTPRQKVRAHCVVQTKGNDITRKSNQRDGSFLLVFPFEETCSTKNGDGRLSKSLTATAAFGSWIWPANSKPLRSQSVRISRFCTLTAWFIVRMEAHCGSRGRTRRPYPAGEGKAASQREAKNRGRCRQPGKGRPGRHS